MKATNEPEVVDRCNECRNQSPAAFCNLSEAAFDELQSLKVSHKFSNGSIIFMEGQPAAGVYMVCAGNVKLSTYSEEGRAIILRIAEPGEVLGLSEVISESHFEKTAHARGDCIVAFVRSKDFLRLVQAHHTAALNALKQLSSNCHKAHVQICSLGLSASVGDKLARLLLQWYDRSTSAGPARISRSHTHGDIAEMIGTSRETVTRLLKDFRDRGLITLSRAELCIPDRMRLKAAIGGRHRNGHNGHR